MTDEFFQNNRFAPEPSNGFGDGGEAKLSKEKDAREETGFDDDEIYISRKRSSQNSGNSAKTYYNKTHFNKGACQQAQMQKTSASNASVAFGDDSRARQQSFRYASQSQSNKTIQSNMQRLSRSSSKPVKVNSKKKKRKKWPYILILILVLLVGAFFYVWNSSFFTNETDTGTAGLSPDIGGIDKASINILLVGIDSDERRETNQLTDTILVASFDINNSQIHVLQIPRDTYIGTTYTKTGKINALYSSGGEYTGIDGLAEFIYDDFAIPIDHYATVTMEGFRMLIDAIGGVTVDVPYPIDLDGVTLEPGEQTLDGNESEKFIRQRHGEGYSNGDLDRLNVQRLFMASLVEQLLQTNKMTLISLVPKLAEQISTDMTTGEMTDLVNKATKLSADNIVFEMVPGESTYVNTSAYGKQSVYSIHKDLLTQMINAGYRDGLGSITQEQILVPEIANTVDNYDDVGGSVNEIVGNEQDATVSQKS